MSKETKLKFANHIIILFLILTVKIGYSQSINIYFKSDSFEVTNESAAKLTDFLAKDKNANNKYRFEIIGRTDNVGDPEYNKQLSLKRANNTKKFLVSKGIDTTNLILLGYGEYKPISNNNYEEGKAQNRCVTVNISKWNERLSSLLDDTLQVEDFDFHSKNGYTKKLNDCCTITIKPYAFADSLGKEINGNIKLRITYYNNAIDMIKSNITMQAKIGSTDIVYKSHLMFNIDAFYNKKPIKAIYENSFSIDCGCEEKLKNSELFSLDNGNWVIISKLDKTNNTEDVFNTKENKKEEKEEVKTINIVKPPPPPTPARVGGGGGGNKIDTCKSTLDPCNCVEYLAGSLYGATYSAEEWHFMHNNKRIRWNFPPMFPSRKDSICNSEKRYENFEFSRLGYIPKRLSENEYSLLKISISEKGFFKKKRYLKIKSSSYKLFPELKAIQKQEWIVKKQETIYSDKELKKKKFSDFRILEYNNDYMLELKDKDTFIRIAIQSKDKGIKEVFEKYKNELNKLNLNTTDSLKKEFERLERNCLGNWCQIRDCYNIFYPENEREMSLVKWRNYINNNRPMFYKNLLEIYNQKSMYLLKYCPIDTTEIICPPKRRGGGLGLGLSNIDEVIEVKDSIKQVKYYFENGKEAHIKQAYIYNKLNKTIVNVENPKYFKCDFSDENNILFLLDYLDKQFLLNGNKSVNTTNNAVEIKLSEIPKSLEQFKKIIKSSR